MSACLSSLNRIWWNCTVILHGGRKTKIEFVRGQNPIMHSTNFSPILPLLMHFQRDGPNASLSAAVNRFWRLLPHMTPLGEGCITENGMSPMFALPPPKKIAKISVQCISNGNMFFWQMTRNISVTMRDTSWLQWSAYRKPHPAYGHVTDDVTWPQTVKVMTMTPNVWGLISLKPSEIEGWL